MGVVLGGGAGEVQPVLAGFKLLTGGASSLALVSCSCTLRREHLFSFHTGRHCKLDGEFSLFVQFDPCRSKSERGSVQRGLMLTADDHSPEMNLDSLESVVLGANT